MSPIRILACDLAMRNAYLTAAQAQS